MFASCLSSCSYIKPQPALFTSVFILSCLSSCSYIKPQHLAIRPLILWVVYHLVPTSNHNRATMPRMRARVVYHLVPTSNHNPTLHQYILTIVVYHLVPTSNHNLGSCAAYFQTLFIILFLHQTTTTFCPSYRATSLFIILFLHQTTTLCAFRRECVCCLSSCSYIKPQQGRTTGHTLACCLSSCSYIKPQRGRFSNSSLLSCLSSCSYIKPQPIAVNLLAISKILCFKLLRNGRAGRILLQKY